MHESSSRAAFYGGETLGKRAAPAANSKSDVPMAVLERPSSRISAISQRIGDLYQRGRGRGKNTGIMTDLGDKSPFDHSIRQVQSRSVRIVP
jgi:hypothetical protein